MGLLQSIAVHDVLHPPRMGGVAMPRMGGRMIGAMGMPTGGFLDRLTGSPLGQIGMALLAGGGGPIGNAAAMLMQQGMMQRLYGARSGPQIEHVGNAIGLLDPSTGEFTPTYTAPQADDEDRRLIKAAGIDPDSPDGQKAYRQILDRKTDPIINVPLPTSMGGGMYSGPQSGFQAALEALQGRPATPGSLAPPTTPSGPLSASVARVESGNRDLNPDGTPVTSSAGAKYAMQVLPSTAHDPGFGVTPAADDSPAEYDRVGRDYLAALQKHYGGNTAEALAAYNTGPGTVDRAIASGRPLPSQGYVNNVTDGSSIVSQAQAAIAAGADPVKVRARAASMGVTLP